MTRRSVLTALALPVLATITLTVAACGGDDSSSTPAETIPPGAVVITAGPGIIFDKPEYTATAGEVVIGYTNKDSTRHTLLVKGADGVVVGNKLEVNSNGDVDTGTYTLTPGTYTIYCDVPGHGAMTAKLIVS